MLHTFDPTNEEMKCQFVCDNIYGPVQVAISTVWEHNIPRNVCVNYDIDENFTVFWKSNSTSRHSQNLLKNPYAWLVFFETHSLYDFAFYASGKVDTVDDLTILEYYMQLKYADKGKPMRSLDHLSWDSPYRLYRCTLQEAYTRSLDQKKSPVNLALLQQERRTRREHIRKK